MNNFEFKSELFFIKKENKYPLGLHVQENSFLIPNEISIRLPDWWFPEFNQVLSVTMPSYYMSNSQLIFWEPIEIIFNISGNDLLNNPLTTLYDYLISHLERFTLYIDTPSFTWTILEAFISEVSCGVEDLKITVRYNHAYMINY